MAGIGDIDSDQQFPWRIFGKQQHGFPYSLCQQTSELPGIEY